MADLMDAVPGEATTGQPITNGPTAAESAAYAALMMVELRESEETMFQVRSWVAEHYKAYRLSEDLDELPYDEKVRLPLSRSATTDRVSRFAGPFVVQDDPITVAAMEGTPPEAAEAQEGLLNSQWHDRHYINGRYFLLKMLKIVDMAGAAWAFVDWNKEEAQFDAPQSERDPITGQTTQVNYPQTLDLDGPVWKIIHPYDAWPDPRCDDETKGRYFYVREELSYTEFKSLVEQGYYSGETADDIAKNGQQVYSGLGVVVEQDKFQLPLEAGLMAPTFGRVGMDPKSRPVFVWHRFDNLSWITADPMGRIMRVAPNPSPDGRIPIRGLIVDPDVQGPVGVPPAEGGHGMNRIANRLASGIMEHLARIVNPTLGIRQDAIDLMGAADVTGAPFEMLILPDENAVFPVRKTDGTLPTIWDGVQSFKYFGDLGGGTSDFRKGLSSSGTPGTATGTQAFLQQADAKFAPAFSLVADFVREMVSLTGLYNQHFLERPQWIYRTGRKGAGALTCQVGRPLIQGNFKYNTTASSARADPMAHAQGVMAMVNVFGPTGMMDLGYTGRYVAELMGVKNPEQMFPGYIPPPIPLDQEIELVRMGLDAPVNPGDDHMEHIDAYSAAAHAAKFRASMGDPEAEGEAERFVAHAQSHMQFIAQLMKAKTGGQDVGNASGEKASDKGRPVGKRGDGPQGGEGPDGGSPGPAGPGRDMGGA